MKMMKKELASVVKVALCALVVLSLALLPSCAEKPDSDSDTPEHPEHPTAAPETT
jgi:hypothetical protein